MSAGDIRRNLSLKEERWRADRNGNGAEEVCVGRGGIEFNF